MVPFVIADGRPSRIPFWAAVATAGVLVGLYLNYAAIRRGPISLVAPVISLEGAVAAGISVIAGEHLAALAALGIVTCVGGMLIVLLSTNERESGAEHPHIALALAFGAACAFGLLLFASNRASSSMSASWLQMLFRLGPLVCVALPMIVARRLELPRTVFWFILGSSTLQFVGFRLFLASSHHIGVAATAVVTAQFSVVALLGGVLSLQERLSRRQIVGLAVLLVGVAVVAGAQG